MKCGGVSSPSILGGLRGWGLVLTVLTSVLEAVYIWFASRLGEAADWIFRGATHTPRVCREGETGLMVSDFKFPVSVLYLA